MNNLTAWFKKPSTTNCGRENGTACPISLEPCPGFCVYSTILHNLQIGIIVLNSSTRQVVFRNQVATEILEPAIKTDDYETISQFIALAPQDDITPEISVSRINAGKILRLDDRLINCSVYQIPDEVYLWIFLNDITEKKRLESIAGAVNSMENIGYIFSGIRHEVGNPINSIKMTLSVLKEQLDTFSPTVIEEYLDRCLSELGRVEFLLHSLKSINIYEAPQIETVDLILFAAQLFPLIQKDFEHKGIQITKDISPSGRFISVDPRALQQVLLNLMTNAADALEKQLFPRIHFSAHGNCGLVWIKVTDNGHGIPEKYLKRLFQPFFTSKSKGTGLGLLLSKKMLARMNCTIEARNDPAHGGAVFTISVPAGYP